MRRIKKEEHKVKKRILSVLLVLCMLCALLPMGVPAAQAYSETDIAYPVEGGNIYFDKETGTITDCDISVTKAEIPAKIDGVAVIGFGDDLFRGNSNLTSVTIPDSVIRIRLGAFRLSFGACRKAASVWRSFRIFVYELYTIS